MPAKARKYRVSGILPKYLQLSDKGCTLSYMGNTQTTKENTMSAYEIKTIQKIMGFTTEEAENLINLMDETGDHPDWSEDNDKQLRNHFMLVLAGE